MPRLNYRVQEWDRAFEAYVNRIKAQTGKPVIICGDLNVIHSDQDKYNLNTRKDLDRPSALLAERESFERILANCNLHDTFRKLYPLRMLVYSYWTDRCAIARKKNWGARMDYFLTSSDTAEAGRLGQYRIIDVKYMSQIEGADHCPVALELSKASIAPRATFSEESVKTDDNDAGKDDV